MEKWRAGEKRQKKKEKKWSDDKEWRKKGKPIKIHTAHIIRWKKVPICSADYKGFG